MAQIERPTNFGLGADAEVRESTPITPRGTSNELATRAIDKFNAGDGNDLSDRRSVIYLQFDLSGLSGATGADLRLTYRNNNLASGRIADTDGVAPDLGPVSFEVYGIPGASFNESTITYLNAPGLMTDGDVGTKDFTSAANLLGLLAMPALGDQNHLPVGGALLFDSPALDSFITSEIAGGRSVAVLAVTLAHNGLIQNSGDPNQQKFGDVPSNWANFNYLFNPKEMITLNNDSSYDADVSAMNGAEGSPWSLADNSTGRFSPTLIVQLIPEPAAGVLGALAAASLMGVRRRG